MLDVAECSNFDCCDAKMLSVHLKCNFFVFYLYFFCFLKSFFWLSNFSQASEVSLSLPRFSDRLCSDCVLHLHYSFHISPCHPPPEHNIQVNMSAWSCSFSHAVKGQRKGDTDSLTGVFVYVPVCAQNSWCFYSTADHF